MRSSTRSLRLWIRSREPVSDRGRYPRGSRPCHTYEASAHVFEKVPAVPEELKSSKIPDFYGCVSRVIRDQFLRNALWANKYLSKKKNHTISRHFKRHRYVLFRRKSRIAANQSLGELPRGNSRRFRFLERVCHSPSTERSAELRSSDTELLPVQV